MAAFEEHQDELAELGISVYAATVDSEEKSAEVRDSGISFPLAWGVERETGDRVGAWWEERRNHIQPSEFLFRKDGRIIQSSYSSGPLARTSPEDVLSLMRYLLPIWEKRAAEKAKAAAETPSG